MNHRVEFLMPVAAPAPYLEETLASMRDQTFLDWGLTAIVDGRDQEIEETIDAMIESSRLNVIALKERQGISRAMNAGLRSVQSELVARIDADDVNLANRLDLQFRFMEAHPEVGLVGGSAVLVDEQGAGLGHINVEAGADIRRRLLRRNRFVHSSVMFRREIVTGMGGYNARCVLREDYELWLRLAAAGPVANLAEPVVKYRLNDGQISRRPMPATTGAYVSAARIDAARALGVPRWEASALNAAWIMAQNETVKTQFGSLARLRRRHGLG